MAPVQRIADILVRGRAHGGVGIGGDAVSGPCCVPSRMDNGRTNPSAFVALTWSGSCGTSGDLCGENCDSSVVDTIGWHPWVGLCRCGWLAPTSFCGFATTLEGGTP